MIKSLHELMIYRQERRYVRQILSEDNHNFW